MIKIIPKDIEGMYLKLRSPILESNDLEKLLTKLAEEFTGEKTQTRLRGRSVNPKDFECGKVPLPEPFSGFITWLKSDGTTYSGLMRFIINKAPLAKKEEVEKVSSNILKKIHQRNDIYPAGEKVFFLKDQKPYFILDTDIAGLPGIFELSFGYSGTLKRKLTSVEAFETDLNEFGRLATDIVNSAYETEPQDITLRFYI